MEIFDYLERAKSGNGGNDCSLADAVQLMAGDKNVRADRYRRRLVAGCGYSASCWNTQRDTVANACRARPLKRADINSPADSMQLRSSLPCDDFVAERLSAALTKANRAENQAHAGNSHPKVKDPLGQTQ